jgi:hypothetical protein
VTPAAGPDLRCSILTRELGERPAGTAGSWHRVILVELPLPWPHDIENHPVLAGAAAGGPDGRTHRILALAGALRPRAAAPDDLRVICYWRAVDAPFAGFRRAEMSGPAGAVAEIVRRLIDADDDSLAALPPDAVTAGPASTGRPVRDLLVCTHGTRDRCCGKLGTDLFRSIADRVPPDVRLWRTSHTGGHRFAPTGLTFPDGGTWAGMDDDLALGLIDRTVDAGIAAARSRGSAGVPAGPAQVADAAALAHLGWAWLDHERDITVQTRDETAVVTMASPTGRHRALLRAGRRLPVPDCGQPLDAARKTTLEWRLESFDGE